MKKLKVGASELELLSYVANSGGVTVGEVADHFARVRGWVRTTVQRTMDRLIAKGLLSRREVKGVFHYRSTMNPKQLEKGLVDQFVSDTLGGSLRPFVAYLSGGAKISDEELSELKAMVEELESTRKEVKGRKK